MEGRVKLKTGKMLYVKCKNNVLMSVIMVCVKQIDKAVSSDNASKQDRLNHPSRPKNLACLSLVLLSFSLIHY